MKLYWQETARLLYLFWFKPLTLHREMNQAAGDPKLLDSSLLTILRKQELRRAR